MAAKEYHEGYSPIYVSRSLLQCISASMAVINTMQMTTMINYHCIISDYL